MYLYFILQGKVCDCDVSVVDCSVGLGSLRVESDKAIFVDFDTQEVILGDSLNHTEPVLNAM